MNEFIKILLHARRLKTNTEELSVEQLEIALEKLTQLLEKRKIQDRELNQKKAQKSAKIEQYKQMMQDDGIDLSELVHNEKPKRLRIKRAPRPPKYGIANQFGSFITWTGQGRMPNLFKEKIEAGENIETFLITKTTNKTNDI